MAGFEIKKGMTILGTYEVLSDAFSGGMGSVWKVRHMGWGADMALKRPHAEMFKSPARIAAYLTECEAWMRLGMHENIVPCWYVRDVHGVPCIFSQWMDRGDLEEAIQSGKLYSGTDREACMRLLDIAVQSARGLAYAHESGLIHRDVKPENLLLASDDTVAVADFGLAAARDDVSGCAACTVPYCSPEQLARQPVTLRTDIYSWAVSVLEMYVGERLWNSGVLAGANLRGYAEDTMYPLPEGLTELLEHCTAPNPEDRPHDFAEVEKRLLAIYQAAFGEEYPRPPSRRGADTADALNNRALSLMDLGKREQAREILERAAKGSPMNPVVQYNRCLAALREGMMRKNDPPRYLSCCWEAAGCPAGSGKLLGMIECETGSPEKTRELAKRYAGSDEGRELSKIAEKKNYRATFVLAKRPGGREEAKRVKKSEEVRREIRHLCNIGRWNEAVRKAEAFSRDPENAFCTEAAEWRSLEEELTRMGSPETVTARCFVAAFEAAPQAPLSFTADGSGILSGSRLYAVPTGELIADTTYRLSPEEADLLIKFSGEKNISLEPKAVYSGISPDGTWFLRAAEGEKSFYRVNARTGEREARFVGHDGRVESLAIRADGREIVSAGSDGCVIRWSPMGERLGVYFASDRPVRRALPRYDSSLIWFVTDRELMTLALPEEEVRVVAEQLEQPRLSVNTAGTRAAVVSEGILYSVSEERQRLERLSGPLCDADIKRPFEAAAFMQNDRFLAAAAKEKLTFFEEKTANRLLLEAPGPVDAAAVSSDGRFLAIASGNRGEIWMLTWRTRFIKNGCKMTTEQAAEKLLPLFPGKNRDTLEKELGIYEAGALPGREFSRELVPYAEMLIAANPRGTAETLMVPLMRELGSRGFGYVPPLDVYTNLVLLIKEKTGKSHESEDLL